MNLKNQIMSYLTIDELRTVAVGEIIHKVTNGDDEIVQQIIDESINEMAGYLAVNYDTDAIFSAEGEARNLTVLKYLKKIVLYELYKRKMTTIDDATMTSYEDAMTWLKELPKAYCCRPAP